MTSKGLIGAAALVLVVLVALAVGCMTTRLHGAAMMLVDSYCDLPLVERRAFRTAFNARSEHKVLIECAGESFGPLPARPEFKDPAPPNWVEPLAWMRLISPPSGLILMRSRLAPASF